MVSQPSLSKTLKTLEQDLGVKLFERKGKYIRLNRMGELFYQNIHQCLNHLDDTVQQLSDMSDSPTGQVNLLINAASTFMPDLYVRFKREYPYIQLLLSNFVRTEHRIYDYDFFISDANHFPIQAKTEGVKLFTERMVLAVTANHPFAKRQIVNLAEAKNMPFVSSNRKEEIEALCQQAGFRPNIAVQCDNGNTYIWMLRNHIGITILPEIALGSILPPEIVCIPFTNPSAERTVSLYWNQQCYMSKAAKLFRDYCIGYFKDIKKFSRALLRDRIGEITCISGKQACV